MTDFISFLKEIYAQRLVDKGNGVEMVSVEDIPYDPIVEYYKNSIAEIQAEINKRSSFSIMLKQLAAHILRRRN